MSNQKKTENHRLYGACLHDRTTTPVIAYGAAGTGKTYGAVGAAIDWLSEGAPNIFIGIRPNVAYADELGYLPGTESEKLAPWVRPLKQNFHKHGMDEAYLSMLEKQGRVQFHPLAFVQGLTFDNAFLMVDECQNMTLGQLKGILTRTGENTRVVLCGDTAQTSEKFKGTGLAELITMINALRCDCHLIKFTHDDVMRSEQCKQWLIAFDKWDALDD